MRLLRIVDNVPVRCSSTNDLTQNHFFDPTNPTKIEVSILCRMHRDSILVPMLRPYQIKTLEIKKKRTELKKSTRKSMQYEIVFDTSIHERISRLEDEKRTISFDSCRDLLCNSEGQEHKLLEQDAVFTLLSFGQNGKLAHWFYFHEECWKRVKRMFGIMDYSLNRPIESMDDYLK